MGLEDFKSEDEYSIGNISTRKKIKNVQLSEDSWRHLLYHDPHWASYFANDLEDEGIKAMVEIMDDLIENGRDGTKKNEDTIEAIEEARDEVVDFHLKED